MKFIILLLLFSFGLNAQEIVISAERPKKIIVPNFNNQISIEASTYIELSNYSASYERYITTIFDDFYISGKIGFNYMEYFDRYNDKNKNYTISPCISITKFPNENWSYVELGVYKMINQGVFYNMNNSGIFPLFNFGYKFHIKNGVIKIFFGLMGGGGSIGYCF